MPTTPDRGNQQPGSSEQGKRPQLHDKVLQGNDDDETEETEVGRIEVPGEEDEDGATPLRTDQSGGAGEDEDLPDDDTQINTNPGKGTRQ